jgi:hypothetical protein
VAAKHYQAAPNGTSEKYFKAESRKLTRSRAAVKRRVVPVCETERAGGLAKTALPVILELVFRNSYAAIFAGP